MADCPSVIFEEPERHLKYGYPSPTNGAFIVGLPITYASQPNRQMTFPTVIKNGVTLQPILRLLGQGRPSSVNSATQHIIVR